MKNMQKIGQLALLFLVLTGMLSCNKDNNTEDFEVIGDVMIVKRMIDDQTYFERSYYAYGNYPMKDVSVSLPEGGNISLQATDETLRTYLKEPGIADFLSAPPITGNFDFSVTNEDIEHTVSDELVFNNLAFATITSADYDGGAVTVEWTPADNAENYLVKIVDVNYVPIFTGFLLSNTVSKYQTSSSAGVWDKTPETGTTYIVEVHAFEYDDEATIQNFVYNINEISIATKSIVWGE